MLSEIDLGHLRRAIEIAQNARQHGNHPFGALIVSAEGIVLAEAENTVITANDPTGHAETGLVRLVGGRFDRPTLAASTLYTSTEPCAMCAGAIHWSGIGRVVYALPESRLYELTGPEAADQALRLPCREVFAHSRRPVEVEGPALQAEAEAVHLGFWTV